MMPNYLPIKSGINVIDEISESSKFGITGQSEINCTVVLCFVLLIFKKKKATCTLFIDSTAE